MIWSNFLINFCRPNCEAEASILVPSCVFFLVWVSFHEQSRFTGQQGKGKAISLIPLYHIHPLRRHLNISWVITSESSPLHIASSLGPLVSEGKSLTILILRAHTNLKLWHENHPQQPEEIGFCNQYHLMRVLKLFEKTKRLTWWSIKRKEIT